MTRLSGLSVLLLVPLTVVLAQDASQPQLTPRPPEPAKVSPNPTPSPADRWITLEVQVTDKSGAQVRGLEVQDFTLLDDKVPLKILSLHAVDHSAPASTDPTVEILLVVDAVNAPFRAVSYERNEIRKFLLQNGGKLAQPVSLLVFADAGSKIQGDSSRDGNALAALYDQYQTGLRSINRSQGFYGATERFDMSLRALHSVAAYEATRPGRKLMIWISPGWPLLSGPNLELTRKEEQQIFNSIVSLSNELRAAGVTLYSIDPLGLADFGVRTSYYEEFLKGVASPRHAQAGDLGLQVLAVQTGGRALNTSNDIAAAISTCTADADAFYVLSFEAPRADHADEYHSLAVAVDRPGVKARTRTGYYAQP
jgi:VWFA-related protein